MVSMNCARRAANFATVLQRFLSRLTRASLAIICPSIALERKAEGGEKRPSFFVGFRRGGNADVHSPQGIDLVELDFRENDLLLDAQAVVATPVEGAAGNPAEVADTRNRDRYQPVEELKHALAAQRHHTADRIVLADLEGRDRGLRF